jgi:hypothetical protein
MMQYHFNSIPGVKSGFGFTATNILTFLLRKKDMFDASTLISTFTYLICF